MKAWAEEGALGDRVQDVGALGDRDQDVGALGDRDQDVGALVDRAQDMGALGFGTGERGAEARRDGERGSAAPTGPEERGSVAPTGPGERGSAAPIGPGERGSASPTGPGARGSAAGHGERESALVPTGHRERESAAAPADPGGLEELAVLLRLCPSYLLYPGQHLPQAAEWILWPVRVHPFQLLCSRGPHVGLQCSNSHAATRGFPPKAPRISHERRDQGSVREHIYYHTHRANRNTAPLLTLLLHSPLRAFMLLTACQSPAAEAKLETAATVSYLTMHSYYILRNIVVLNTIFPISISSALYRHLCLPFKITEGNISVIFFVLLFLNRILLIHHATDRSVRMHADTINQLSTNLYTSA